MFFLVPCIALQQFEQIVQLTQGAQIIPFLCLRGNLDKIVPGAIRQSTRLHALGQLGLGSQKLLLYHIPDGSGLEGFKILIYGLPLFYKLSHITGVKFSSYGLHFGHDRASIETQGGISIHNFKPILVPIQVICIYSGSALIRFSIIRHVSHNL